jgi:hypothetical protein
VETQLEVADLPTDIFFNLSPTTVLSGDLRIQNNAALTDLSSLANLIQARSLTLSGNAALVDLDDFVSLMVLNSFATVTDNAMLADCCTFPGQVVIGGEAAEETNASFIVSGNTGDCADKASLAAADCSSAFPVTLRYFRVEREQGDRVSLIWSTGSSATGR